MKIRPTLRFVLLLFLALLISPALATRPAEETEFYKRYVTYAPYPDFPMAAVRRGAHGTGVFLLKINSKTGLVEEVKVLKRVGDGGLTAEVTHVSGQPLASSMIRLCPANILRRFT